MVSYCHCLTALQLYPFHTMTASAARAAGPGWHAMTNAEWAAIALLCYSGAIPARQYKMGAVI